MHRHFHANARTCDENRGFIGICQIWTTSRLCNAFLPCNALANPATQFNLGGPRLASGNAILGIVDDDPPPASVGYGDDDESPKKDCRVVQCNYKSDTSACRVGARAYLSYQIDVAGYRVLVVAKSRSGRWIVKWESLMDLHKFRVKTLVAEDPLASSKHPIARDYWSQEVVDNLNRISGQIT
jgi:hypothetical protein